MNSRFSGQNTGFRRKNERERLFVVAAAGLAFSLLIITVIIFNFRTTDADASSKGVRVESSIPQSVGTVTILAPKRTIPEGSKLSEVELVENYWPIHKVPKDAIRDRSELQNLYAMKTLDAGSPILRSMTSREPVQSTLPVTPGNRAVTIQVDAISSIEGHIKAGSLVDVALTYNEGGELTTKLIVQSARVISYGGQTKNMNPFIDQGPRTVFSTATLDVPPQDAMTILTAKKLGSLSLLMRSTEDMDRVVKDEVTEGGVAQNKNEKNPTKGKGAICGHASVGGIQVAIPCTAGEQLSRFDSDDM